MSKVHADPNPDGQGAPTPEASTALQRESAALNEALGVIAQLDGVVARIAKATTLEEVKTIAEMASTITLEWIAGIWKPDDPADWGKP